MTKSSSSRDRLTERLAPSAPPLWTHSQKFKRAAKLFGAVFGGILVVGVLVLILPTAVLVGLAVVAGLAIGRLKARVDGPASEAHASQILQRQAHRILPELAPGDLIVDYFVGMRSESKASLLSRCFMVVTNERVLLFERKLLGGYVCIDRIEREGLGVRGLATGRRVFDQFGKTAFELTNDGTSLGTFVAATTPIRDRLTKTLHAEPGSVSIAAPSDGGLALSSPDVDAP